MCPWAGPLSTQLLFGALRAGQVTLLRERKRKRMSFNPIPKSPSSAVIRNTMLDDTLLPKRIGLMWRLALLFNWSPLTVIVKEQVWGSSGMGSEPANLGRPGWTTPLDTTEVPLDGLRSPSSKEENLLSKVSQFLRRLLPKMPAQCPGKRREEASIRTDSVLWPYAWMLFLLPWDKRHCCPALLCICWGFIMLKLKTAEPDIFTLC